MYHGMFMPCLFEGELSFYSGPAAGRRIYGQLASELGCSLSNILKPVTAASIARNLRKRVYRETSSIISDLSDYLVMDYDQVEPHRIAGGVASGVVDCFFEDQE